MTKALADMLDAALVERNEARWKTVAFVHRHEIAAALRLSTPPPPAAASAIPPAGRGKVMGANTVKQAGEAAPAVVWRWEG